MKTLTKTFEELKSLKLTSGQSKKIVGGDFGRTFQDRTHIFNIKTKNP